MKIVDEIYKRSKPVVEPKHNVSEQVKEVLESVPAGKYKKFEVSLTNFLSNFRKINLLFLSGSFWRALNDSGL